MGIEGFSVVEGHTFSQVEPPGQIIGLFPIDCEPREMVFWWWEKGVLTCIPCLLSHSR